MSGKNKEKSSLRVSEKLLKHNTVIGQNKHGFMKGKLRLTNLILFYGKIIRLMDAGKAMQVEFFYLF